MNKKQEEFKQIINREKQINRILSAEITELKMINKQLHSKIEAWEYDYNTLKEDYNNLISRTFKNRLKNTVIGKNIVKLKRNASGQNEK